MTDHQPAIAKLADLDMHLDATQARLEAMAQDANGANAISAVANRAFIRDTWLLSWSSAPRSLAKLIPYDTLPTERRSGRTTFIAVAGAG